MPRERDSGAPIPMTRQDWDKVLEELHPASYRWAVTCCRGDREEARDVLQTVYVDVLEGRARFDGLAGVRTWLFAVIRRTAAGRPTFLPTRPRVSRPPSASPASGAR